MHLHIINNEPILHGINSLLATTPQSVIQPLVNFPHHHKLLMYLKLLKTLLHLKKRPPLISNLLLLSQTLDYHQVTSKKDPNVIHIGAALPPISGKLIKRIEQGSFIEMTELLPESLGHLVTDDDQSAVSKPPKRRIVLGIVEWLQCFGTYIAIISRKQPTRVIDLLGYQSLIIQAYQEYQGDCRLGYDRCFKHQAAAIPSAKWAIADSTLWNLAFSG